MEHQSATAASSKPGRRLSARCLKASSLLGCSQTPSRQHRLGLSAGPERSIIFSIFEHCIVGVELLDACMEAAGDSRLKQMLSDTFAGKSNGTLDKRSGRMARYLDWAWNKNLEAFPLNEVVVYTYVTSLTFAAPSAATSFIEALNFCRGTLGLAGVAEVLESSRINGAATNQFVKKAPLRQRGALTHRQLVGLECLACTAPSCQDRVAEGAFRFMAYSRSRLSDLNCIRELKFELLPSGLGFVEAKAMANKTATTQEKKARFLPITAVVQPLAPAPHNWALSWHPSRKEAGLDYHRFLLPVPTSCGGWRSRPLTAGEACSWLRDLLQQAGCDLPNQALGTPKVTLLSWMAKYGASPSVHHALGYHVEPGDLSLLTHSRDAAAGALRELAAVLLLVKLGQFMPDESRSGRLAGETEVPEEAPAPSDEADQASRRTSGEEDYSSSSFSGSWTSSESETEGEAVDEIVDELLPQRTVDVEFDKCDSKKLFRHKVGGTVHFQKHDHVVKFMCGRFVHSSYKQITTRSGGCNVCEQCLACAQKFPEAVGLKSAW